MALRLARLAAWAERMKMCRSKQEVTMINIQHCMSHRILLSSMHVVKRWGRGKNAEQVS